MPFRIPSESERVHPLQTRAYPQDLSILAYGQSGNGVVSGCAVTEVGGSQVGVASGVVIVNGVRTSISSQNVGIALGTIMPRFDLVVAYSNGTVSALTGQEAEAPNPRDVPTNGVVLAMVYVVAMDRSIEAYQIVDKRVFVRIDSGGIYNVLDYGATGDGVTDDTVAIQAAMSDSLVITNNALIRAGKVIFPRGQYVVSASLTIPLFSNGGYGYGIPMLFSGYGAEILAQGAISVFKRLPPSSSAEANNSAVVAPIFEGFVFRGPNVAGSKAIEMVATYGMRVRDCVIGAFDVGISMAFCLKSYLENVFVQNCLTYGFSATSGSSMWSGASESNHTHFNSCRVSASNGQAACFYLRDADNYRLDQCICEGGNPVNNVDYYTKGRYTLVVQNMHFENTPTGAHLRIQTRGRAVIRNPVFYTTNTVLIDGTNSHDAATIVIDGLTYIDTGNQFKHTSGSTEAYAWEFRGIGDYETTDTSGSTRWVGGVVPTRLRTLTQGLAIGVNDQTIRKRARGANSIADGGTIAHGLGATPVIGRVQASLAGQFASLTGMNTSNLTVAIKQHDGTSGSTQTIYWEAET